MLTIFYPISIFLFGVTNKEKHFIKPIEYIGEHLSLNIYIFHIFVSGVIHGILKFTSPLYEQNIICQWIYPILVALGSILFALIINKINIRKSNLESPKHWYHLRLKKIYIFPILFDGVTYNNAAGNVYFLSQIPLSG